MSKRNFSKRRKGLCNISHNCASVTRVSESNRFNISAPQGLCERHKDGIRPSAVSNCRPSPYSQLVAISIFLELMLRLKTVLIRCRALAKCPSLFKCFSCTRLRRVAGRQSSKTKNSSAEPIIGVPPATPDSLSGAVCRKCDGHFDPKHFKEKDCIWHSGISIRRR